MKTKGKKQNLTVFKLLITWAVAVCLAVPIRMYQLFGLTDTHGTGFYDRIDWSVYTLYALLVVFAILLAVLTKFTKNISASRPVMCKNQKMGIVSLLLAVGIGYDSAFMIFNIVKMFRMYLGDGLLKYLFANGILSEMLQVICGVFACIYMILFGMSYLDGKTTFREYKLLALMPLFWSMFRMVFRFMTKISFIRVTDLLLELFAIAFEMLFFMSFARVSSQLSAKGEMRKLVAYGFIGAMFAAVIGVTRFVVTIGGRTDLLPANIGFSLADPAFSVFSIVYIFQQTKYGRPASEDDSLLSEEEELALENATDDDFLKEN